MIFETGKSELECVVMYGYDQERNIAACVLPHDIVLFLKSISTLLVNCSLKLSSTSCRLGLSDHSLWIDMPSRKMVSLRVLIENGEVWIRVFLARMLALASA